MQCSWVPYSSTRHSPALLVEFRLRYHPFLHYPCNKFRDNRNTLSRESPTFLTALLLIDTLLRFLLTIQIIIVLSSKLLLCTIVRIPTAIWSNDPDRFRIILWNNHPLLPTWLGPMLKMRTKMAMPPTLNTTRRTVKRQLFRCPRPRHEPGILYSKNLPSNFPKLYPSITALYIATFIIHF